MVQKIPVAVRSIAKLLQERRDGADVVLVELGELAMVLGSSP